MNAPATPTRLVLPKSKKEQPYDYIERHYRDPGAGPVERWLPHPDVARAVCGALLAHGVAQGDLEDGLQEVYLKALTAFSKGAAVPADLRAMKAYCATIAKNHAIDALRKAAKRERDFAGNCENPDDFTPLEQGAAQRDPVDAGRQLEVAAQLFREGKMPQAGVEILEGIASGCTLDEIGRDLGITLWAVRGRLDTMNAVFRRRMARLGILPGMVSLRAVVSMPRAVEALRRAA